MESYLIFCSFLGFYAIFMSFCYIVEFFFGTNHFFPSFFQYRSLMKLYCPAHKCTYKEYKFLFLPKMENDVSNCVFITIDRILCELKENVDHDNKK